METKTQVEVPTGVVTALLADVEGSVRQWEADDEAMATEMAKLDELLDDVIADHHGVRPLEQGEGDSFVAAFVVPSDAVACALAVQEALASSPLRLRMAIHTDDAIVRGTANYSGAVVNRAARLRALAHGGQVLVSGSTCELVAGKLPTGAGFVDLGVHRLRDVMTPLHVWQLRAPGLPADFPPLRSPDARVTNLPAQLTTFVGRVDELRAARKLLFENQLVSLTGAGGTGKTRLALELAADAFDSYPNGVWFVDLTTVQDPAKVAEAIASALLLNALPSRTALEAITAHIADDRVLLVLDNCEHVVGAVASFVDALLRVCPNTDVVVTSREPLNVGGEATFHVPPMELPESGADISSLANNDAVELFVDRAHRADPNFELNAASTRAVADICRRVEGLPLAIELAAARVRVLSIDEIAETLSRRLDVLVGGARTAPRRQHSVADCVAWSYDLLDDAERALLRRLSLFDGSFAVDAAEAVGADDASAEQRVLPTLLALVDKSLVHTVAGRYRLLRTVREFAADRLAESGDDVECLRARHLKFYLDLAARSQDGFVGANHDTWLARMRTEDPNLDAALDWAAEHDRQRGLELATALVPYSLQSMNTLRGWRWVEPFMAEVPSADPKVAADASFAAALGLLFCGDMALAMQGPGYLNDALVRYEQLGDHVGCARARGLLAVMSAMAYPTKAAQADCEASITELRTLGDEVWATLVLSILGGRQVQVGGARAAMPYLDEALAIAQRLGQAFLVNLVDTWRAGAHGMLGDHRTAMDIAQRVLDDLRDQPDPDHGSFMNFVIGDGYFHLGDLEAAEHHGRIAASAAERHHIKLHAALAQSLLGRVHFQNRNFEEARQAFERAIELSEATQYSLSRHSTGLAGALLELGRLDEARAALDRGLEAARAGAASSDLARLLLLTATIETRAGNDTAAEDVLYEVLVVALEVGAVTVAAAGLEHLAAIAARQESDVAAVRLFAAAAVVREGLGRRAGDDSVLDVTRTRIGDNAFAAAWAEGAAMSLEEAVAYASRGRGTRRRPSTGWASLTPTETDVVRLVAQGLSNPQIGERLLITRGTVRTHLTHIFTKLGVTSRSQLAAEATRRSLS